MKLALFFFASLALHAAVLVVPLSFKETRQAQAITVSILPLEGELPGSGGSGNSTGAKSNGAGPRAKAASTPPNPHSSISPIPSELSRSDLNIDASGQVTSVANVATYVTTNFEVTNGNGASSNRVGGNGAGSLPTGTGAGIGVGTGQGSGQSGVTLTQASYRETPQPRYPESARREGREGRVLLRVLVDEQGKTKNVEVNHSSGSDALDRAAAEAIRRWRFHPARYGDQPVESWLRIPIEFRLADAKPW